LSLRRLSEHQPESFAFNAENAAWCAEQIKKYPPGRQASAVISILWRGQEQEGWVNKPMIEEVARMLGMAPVRVLEVATFYTMFNLRPVGEHLVQVCTTTPCWLRGSDAVVAACKKHIHPHQGGISADGKFSWVEMECLGACVNAPMILIDKDPFEDLDEPKMEGILETIRRGEWPKPGPQNGRHSSEPEGGATTLTDPALYTKHAKTGEGGAGLTDAAAKRPGDPASVRDAPTPQTGDGGPKGLGA
jgi:NADH-quinone oxidoreductase subunit E